MLKMQRRLESLFCRMLAESGASVVTACREKGFLVNCIQDRILRLAPPLIVGRPEIDGLVQCLDEVLA